MTKSTEIEVRDNVRFVRIGKAKINLRDGATIEAIESTLGRYSEDTFNRVLMVWRDLVSQGIAFRPKRPSIWWQKIDALEKAGEKPKFAFGEKLYYCGAYECTVYGIKPNNAGTKYVYLIAIKGAGSEVASDWQLSVSEDLSKLPPVLTERS
jgi:hypothetical protein